MPMITSEPAALAPLALAEARAFLNISRDDDDAVLIGHLRSAAELCEQFIGQSLLVRQHREAIAVSRELLSGAGVRSVSVSAAGLFLGSDAETAIRVHAMNGTLDEYELSFESGARMRGRFLVARLEYAGDFNGERNYSLALESSGAVTSL